MDIHLKKYILFNPLTAIFYRLAISSVDYNKRVSVAWDMYPSLPFTNGVYGYPVIKRTDLVEQTKVILYELKGYR